MKMAEEETKKQLVLKKKKKRWIPIFVNKMFNEVQIGDSYVAEPGLLMGRYLEINLMELTNDIKKQNIKVMFKINNVAENRATADLVGYELLGSVIRRVVKRAKSKIDDSFIVETKDNIKVIVKSIILTKTKTAHSILTKLRFKSKESMITNFKKWTYDEAFAEILSHNLQKNLRDSLKKIYPVSVVEVRYFRKL